MPPPDDGNETLPFVELIKLEQKSSSTYHSVALPFSPGGRLRQSKKRSYGGHVYAQAAWAACQTVAEGFLIYVCKYLQSAEEYCLSDANVCFLALM